MVEENKRNIYLIKEEEFWGLINGESFFSLVVLLRIY